MLTDNDILIRAAQKNYDKFLVPTNLVSAKKIKRVYTNTDKSDLDFKNSHNLIGDIINLSQELNTLLWDMVNNGSSFDDIQPIYYDIAMLEVMSNVEIDSSKKEFTVENGTELKLLKDKYCRRDNTGRLIKPYFFGHISREKGYYNPKKKNYMKHDTAMDYLQPIS